MSNANKEHSSKMKRTGWSGLALGALALLACELPIILALLGLSGFSAGTMFLRPSSQVEITGAVIGVAGALMLVGLAVRRVFRPKHVRKR